MKQKLIGSVVVLVISAAIIVTSLLVVRDAVYKMEDYSMQALEMVDRGDLSGAEEQMTQMADTWDRKMPVLEMLVPHESLHRVIEHYVEASANLRCEHLDDYYMNMALLAEALKHIRSEEMPSWSNTF